MNVHSTQPIAPAKAKPARRHAAKPQPKKAKDAPAEKLSRKDYEKALLKLQTELCYLQDWVRDSGARVVIVLEGRDTAGKGGLIKRLTERVSPRTFRVVALSAPSERDSSKLYLQRYIEHFPAGGEIVIFDRSWYNRAGVERVMGYCTQKQAEDFLEATPEFEKHLVDDGILLFKYWLCVDQERQEERFHNRLKNPRRRWKLSSVDIESRKKYEDYTLARERMLEATHTAWAPWTLVDFNDQPVGRLTLLRHFLDVLPDTKLPVTDIPWPPLKHPPLTERYGVIEPIANYRIQDPGSAHLATERE